MIDVLDGVEEWLEDGKKVALVTLIATERSAPRDPGAALAVNEDGKVLVCISGGCVEPAAISEAMNVIETGVPQRMTYGMTDEDPCAAGLTWGGTVHLMIERVDW